MRKALPSNVEAEQRILHAIFMSPRIINQVAALLRPEDFYRDAHTCIFEAMLSLAEQREMIEGLAVETELEKMGKPIDTHIIDEIHDGTLNLDNLEYYVKTVKDMSVLRGSIEVAQQLAQDAYSLETETITRAMSALARLDQGRGLDRNQELDDALDLLLPKMELACERRKTGQVLGIPTGFTTLDYVLGGLQPSDLITLAARPGVGKTSFALMMAYNVLMKAMQHKFRIQIFSLEMNTEQLARRILSIDSMVDQTKMRAGDIDADEWERIRISRDRLKQGRMWVDDTPALSIEDLMNRARHYHDKHKFDFLIVDYMQLMHSQKIRDKGNRVLEVGEISKGLKELARELNVPVLALAQLSREVEKRANKEPQLSDLRESGSIEQDSDVVGFIHPDPEGVKTNTGYFVNIIIAKHRNGPTGIVPLHFTPSLTRFDDAEFNREGA